MAPDPPVYSVDENVSHNYDAALALHNSDDSDGEVEEQPAYDGYTLLGQHELNGQDSEINDIDEVIEINSTDISHQVQEEEPTPPTAGVAELVALWNSAPEISSSNIALDDERSAQIRAAMAGFSLPPSSVPAWASNIPEELWKEKILDRLQHKN